MRETLRLIALFSLVLIALSAQCRVNAGELLSDQPDSAAPITQETRSLEMGKAISRELSGGEEHTYQITLSEGQYASVIVEQRGVDVVVRLLGTQGNLITSFNLEYRNQGEERVEVVAESAGVYRLAVKAFSKSAPTGQYEIRVAESHAATNDERLLQEARKLRQENSRAFRAGEYEAARQFSERALAISEKVLGTDDPFVATVLTGLANYYVEKEDLAKAESVSKRILAITEKAFGVEDPRTIDASRRLARVYYAMNELAKAEPLAQRAVELAQKILGPDHYLVAHALHTLAWVTRDSKKAEQLLKRALMVGEKTVGSEDYFIGTVLEDLGSLYAEIGDYQQAEQYVLRSKALKEKLLGPEQVGLAINLNNLGRIARARKDYASAEEYYQRAIAIIGKSFGPDNSRLAIFLNNLANIYRAKGDYPRSLEAHLRVLRIAETTRGPSHPLTLQSLGNIAKTYAAQGNIGEAIKFQSRAEAVIERNTELNLAIGSERRKLSYLNSIAERTDRTISLSVDLAPNDPSASALAALVLLQRKGRVQDALSRSFASLRQRSTPEEQSLLERLNSTTAQLAGLVLNGPQGMSFEEHKKKVQELEEERERLETEISRNSAEFRAQSQPVTLAAVQAAIPSHAALIEFAVYRQFDPKADSNNEAYGEPRYVAGVIRQKGDVRWQDLGDARSIDEAIASFRHALRDPLRRDVRERSRAIDEKVMEPVRRLVSDATQLLISADGGLSLIPFEALVDEQGRYLLQRYSFSYLTSGRDLLRLQVSREGQNPSLVIANPLFGEPDLPAERADRVSFQSVARKRAGVTTAKDWSDIYFAPLAGTALEAKRIKALFPQAHTLVGGQATESALKQSSAPRTLHVATHGFFLTGGPASAVAGANVQTTRAISANVKIENPLLRSGLALAGANLRNSNDDDGILTALEASGLNLWGTQLVTLSACDTGLGEVINGEGVYGLRRAFVLSGAETLVMSLWPVSDYVTLELMTSYYSGLKQGQGRGDALRQVQLKMLKRKERQHPFYWASFIQSGEWANLDGRR